MVGNFKMKSSISKSLFNKSGKLSFLKPGVLELSEDEAVSVIASRLAIKFSLLRDFEESTVSDTVA